MRLYFMRHADAMNVGDWGGEEAARPLTDKGRHQAAAAATGLATLRPRISVIISSPYARAYETAVIVSKAVGLPVESSDDLTPGFDIHRLAHILSMRTIVDGALFVGHEPDLSGLIVRLISRDQSAELTMKKSSCCLVLTPAETSGTADAMLWEGRCELGWVRTWRELSALTEEVRHGG